MELGEKLLPQALRFCAHRVARNKPLNDARPRGEPDHPAARRGEHGFGWRPMCRLGWAGRLRGPGSVSRSSSRVCHPALGFSFPDPGLRFVTDFEAQQALNLAQSASGQRLHAWVLTDLEQGARIVVEVVKGLGGSDTSIRSCSGETVIGFKAKAGTASSAGSTMRIASGARRLRISLRNEH